MIELSLEEARGLLLEGQGLAGPRKAARKADVLAAIRRMGALQIDTISVVNRSPYFVLWSRLGAYEPKWLDELLEEGALFEYWAHAACFLPREDYALFQYRMGSRSDRWFGWIKANESVIERVLAHVRENGGAYSSDFESDRARGGWWDWKDEKLALEVLFNHGDLMIAKRRNFQRRYDLRERVFPDWDAVPAASEHEARKALTLKATRALGVATPRWAGIYFNMSARTTLPLLKELAGEGLVHEARVQGIEEPAFVHQENVDLHESARGEQAVGTTLLSPFDPIVWDRKRALQNVRLRLPDRVLHAGAEADLRLLHAADPAPRPAGGAGGPEGAPQGRHLRGQERAPGAGGRGDGGTRERGRGGGPGLRRVAPDAGGGGAEIVSSEVWAGNEPGPGKGRIRVNAGNAGQGRLAGKVAIVTGAGSSGPGIGNGRATAVLFAREGAKVALVDNHIDAGERDAGDDCQGAAGDSWFDWAHHERE